MKAMAYIRSFKKLSKSKSPFQREDYVQQWINKKFDNETSFQSLGSIILVSCYIETDQRFLEMLVKCYF